MAEVIQNGAPATGGEPDQPEWALLVGRIQQNDPLAAEELYRIFSKGVRYYIFRYLGPQDLNHLVHDSCLTIVQAIQRGELRDPERLASFAHTIVRRQIADRSDPAVQQNSQQADLKTLISLPDSGMSPEEAVTNEEKALAVAVLQGMSQRDREILTRFYLREQSQEEICRDLDLTETRFRLLKARAKARFGKLAKRKMAH